MDILTLVLARKMAGGSGGGLFDRLVSTGLPGQVIIMGENEPYWEYTADAADLAEVLASNYVLPALADVDGKVLVDSNYAILIE